MPQQTIRQNNLRFISREKTLVSERYVLHIITRIKISIIPWFLHSQVGLGKNIFLTKIEIIHSKPLSAFYLFILA